jgi:hypothetical protein
MYVMELALACLAEKPRLGAGEGGQFAKCGRFGEFMAEPSRQPAVEACFTGCIAGKPAASDATLAAAPNQF